MNHRQSISNSTSQRSNKHAYLHKLDDILMMKIFLYSSKNEFILYICANNQTPDASRSRIIKYEIHAVLESISSISELYDVYTAQTHTHMHIQSHAYFTQVYENISSTALGLHLNKNYIKR